MKYTLFFLFSLAHCWGCISEREPEVRPKVTVELTVRPDPMTTTTRATDETTIRDLNFYLMDKAGRTVIYRYLATTTLRFECPPGVYLMRIAANVGRSLGESADLSRYMVTYQQDYETLPMFYEQETTISCSSGGVVQLPPISVKRFVSKISYNLTVKPADMELKSVQLMSVPRTAALFAGDSPVSGNPDDYTNGLQTALTGRQAAGFYYMLPNLQGVNTSITDQKQKNADNAPDCASWLLIRATRGSKVLAYSVYLGENNTSDFNVRVNNHYTLNITLLNDNTADTRIAAYTASVYDDYENSSFGGHCVYTPDNCLYIEMINDNYDLSINGRLEIMQGDSNYFSFNRREGSNSWDFEIDDIYGFNDYYLDYCPSVYTRENSTLSYRVTLTDEYGFAQNYDFTHKLANLVTVYANTADRITADNYLYSQSENWNKGKLTRFLCYDDDLKLIAATTGNTVFDGWYDDAAYTTKLSSATTYTLKPSSRFHSIYARFRAANTPLDSQETANCYIAPKLNTGYSFNATVQGNGKTTTNIWPQQLHGASARTLWETGTLSKTVIKDVTYADGRISFTTGTAHGNAVIGLFDAAGNCIWSWHIWSVDYAPATTAQTYVSGAVFMDRNLGALTDDCMQPSSRGLYYQWGRKDPFIHPATCQDIVKRADAVYAEGFEYAVSEPRNAVAESPYDVMTVEWSIAHPTTFMNDAMYEDWEEWTSRADWHYCNHPNLWGNVTTNKNNISKISNKSIYDPCPAGWKVPSPEDFWGITGISQSMPYYVTIHYNGNRMTNIPLGGTLAENRYMSNGKGGILYTNAPYHMRWDGYTRLFYDIACTMVSVTASNPPTIGTMDYYRYAANPIRCIRE